MSLFQEVSFYVEVLIPLPVHSAFTYSVPQHLAGRVSVGKRVVVPFQRTKFYAGIVTKLMDQAPDGFQVKSIEEVIDDEAIITFSHLKFWTWIADYYMGPLGQVMHMALPSALKLASKTVLLKNPDFEHDSDLSDDEFLVFEAIAIREKIDLDEAAKIIGKKSAFGVVKSLLQKGSIVATEEITEKIIPKTDQFIQLNKPFQNDTSLRILFDTLEKAPKQLDVLMVYLQQTKSFEAVARNSLLRSDQVSSSALSALIKKEIFVQEKRIISRFAEETHSDYKEIILSNEQQRAKNEVIQYWKTKPVVLLHGVTGSGKTAIYTDLLRQNLLEGKNALYLVPEIALTTQLVGRLRRVFGSQVGVYHSKMSEQERAELWLDVASGKFPIVLAVRSGIFLPFQHLGLIIVDEEHESAFKQFESAPRFHARDAALVLAKIFNASTLLGSATPSMESYHHGKSGKYGLVSLLSRFGDAILPQMELIDLNKAKEQKTLKEYFSKKLLESIAATVERKEQVILFRNRRGYNPVQQCETCGTLVECPKCDVSLNYHKGNNSLVCHYCGHTETSVSVCPKCGSHAVAMLGYGTEKVEEDFEALFPEYSIARLDQDIAQRKSAFKEIFQLMESGKLDVLIGTQMIAKGLDFENVTLVGILNADQALGWIDFRAVERAFQQLMQVSGRAGRHQKQGKVLIQTRQPDHPMFQYLLRSDYPSFFAWQLLERKRFQYPPFTKLIVIQISAKSSDILDEGANLLAKKLRISLPDGVLGPVPPPIARINNRYYRTIQIKMDPSKMDPQVFKAHLKELIQVLLGAPIFKQLFVLVDVDPV